MILNSITMQLKVQPWARERRNRHDFIMDLIEHKLINGYTPLNRKTIKDFIDEYNTCVRYIQIAQKEDESLQGKDYKDGKVLVQQTVLGLGYETGYKEFNNKVKML